jgi:hypothetical protein
LSTNASYVDIGEFCSRDGKKIGLDVQVDISPPCDQQFLPVSFLSGTEAGCLSCDAGLFVPVLQ